MLVLRKVTADPHVHRLSSFMNRWGRLIRRLAERRHQRRLSANPRTEESGHWSLNLFRYPIADVINSFGADIVHVHWVGDNILPIGEMSKIKAPIVWTLRDMWAFTGGCHYAGDVRTLSVKAAAIAPQLLAGSADDISARVNLQKRQAWADLPMTIVCLSQWLAECAAKSALFKDKRIEVVGNPLDPSIFKPHDKTAARSAFNLPADKKLILFGAIGGTSDSAQGISLPARSLARLRREQRRRSRHIWRRIQ